jgi:putative SOS response-associated peptidase YedK
MESTISYGYPYASVRIQTGTNCSENKSTPYTMITQNCDDHPLLKLMHKPDPKLPADQQDKRTVVSLEPNQWDLWLNGTPAQAEDLIHVPALELFLHGAADPIKQVSLPLE